MAARRYQAALESLSKATKTPLPALITSFAILHELTAIGTLIPIFFIAKGLGVGETLMEGIRSDGENRGEENEKNWIGRRFEEWTLEGEKWAARIGRRYGVMGFEKGQSSVEGISGKKVVGDVANAVVAYGATKLLLPVRIGTSLYLSPAFSRRIVQPMGTFILRPFRSK